MKRSCGGEGSEIRSPDIAYSRDLHTGFPLVWWIVRALTVLMEATRASLDCEVKGREMDFRESVSQSVTGTQRTASINGVTPTITARRRSHSSPAALSTTATSSPGTEHPSVD